MIEVHGKNSKQLKGVYREKLIPTPTLLHIALMTHEIHTPFKINAYHTTHIFLFIVWKLFRVSTYKTA